MNLDGKQNTASDEIPFSYFLNDILNSAGGELWIQSDLSRYMMMMHINSDFALNYDKDQKTLQKKILDYAIDSQCNSRIKFLFLLDDNLIQ